jgi:hypothetical protein
MFLRVLENFSLIFAISLYTRLCSYSLLEQFLRSEMNIVNPRMLVIFLTGVGIGRQGNLLCFQITI